MKKYSKAVLIGGLKGALAYLIMVYSFSWWADRQWKKDVQKFLDTDPFLNWKEPDVADEHPLSKYEEWGIIRN